MEFNEQDRIKSFERELLEELDCKKAFVADKEEALKYLEKVVNSTKKIPTLHEASNADYLLIFYYAINNDKLRSFNEANIIINKFRDEVEEWTLEKNGADIKKILDYLESFDDNEEEILYGQVKVEIDRLNIPYEMLRYKVLWPLRAIYILLEYKDFIACIEKNNNSKKSIKELTTEHINKSTLGAFNDSLNKFYESYKKNLATNRQNLKSIERIAEMVKSGEIKKLTIMPPSFETLRPEALEHFLYYLHDQLREKYNTLFLNNKRLNQEINATPLKKYLFDSGINIESIEESLVTYIEKNEPDKAILLIDLLKNTGLSHYQIFVEYKNLFYDLSLEEIENIKLLLKSGALKKQFLKSIILDIKTYLPHLISSYNILNPIIDFNNQYYEEKLLLKPLDELKDILSILAQYNFTKHNYLFLLSNFNYLKIYDLMLEQDIPLYLFIAICKTKKPINTIKKIIISKQIGVPFETEEHTLEKGIAHENRFFVPDSQLDDYLLNLVPEYVLTPIQGKRIDTQILKNTYVKEIENLRKGDCYIIGKTKISRPKFLRNIQFIKDSSLNIKSYIPTCLMSDSILENNGIYDILSTDEISFQKK